MLFYWSRSLNLKGLESRGDIVVDAVCQVVARLLVEFEACYVLVELYVAVAYFLAIFIGHLWHFLSFFAHEAVGDEPLAYEFFAELLLRKSLFKEFFVGVSIEIAA